MRKTYLISYFLRYQWRERLLLTLMLAILMGVGTLAAVGFFSSSVTSEMDAQASQLLGADWLIESSVPLSVDVWNQRAQELNLQSAQTVEFLSMIAGNGHFQLASIKAVDAGYPLRGELQVQDSLNAAEQVIHTIPQPGEVWVNPRLLPAFNMQVGDSLEIGSSRFKITRLITHEPDAGLAFLAMAPRVLMNSIDLPRTQLIAPGSRIEYRFLVAGDKQDIITFSSEIKPQLTPQQEVTDNMTSRPELVRPIDSLLNFLTLTALIIFLLTALAISLAARTYTEKQTDSTAILRCLGATWSDIRAAYLSSLLLLAIIMSVMACMIGYGICQIFIQLALNVWDIALPLPELMDTLVISVCTGIILVFGFIWPWLHNLQYVPPLRVLQRQLQPITAPNYLIYGCMIVALSILWSFYQTTLLMLWAWLAIVVVVSCFALLAFMLLQLITYLSKNIKMPWRLGMLQITHAKRSSLMQMGVYAFALTIMFFFLLIRQDFLNTWENKFPPDAPNYFVINLLPTQVSDVESFFTLQHKRLPIFYPMVRARITDINNKPVVLTEYHDDVPNVLKRDLNLSFTDILSDKTVIKGQTWDQSTSNKALISVEESMAKELKVEVGDTLSFLAGDVAFTAAIANIRTVDWYTMQPNFYVISTPNVLMNLPTTYLASFYLSHSDENFINTLVARFPNLTFINVDEIMNRLKNLIDQALTIIEVLFFLVCLAVFLVLWVIMRTQADARAFISAVLHTLGATNGQLMRGWLSEFAIIGFIAGTIAILLAQILSASVAKHILDLSSYIHWVFVITAPFVGAMIYMGLGFFMLRRLMRAVPIVRLTGE